MRRAFAAALLLALLAGGCSTIAPATDFPILAQPEEVQLEEVRPIKTENGWLYSDADFLSLAENIQALLTELRIYRRIVEHYNAWARERRGKTDSD